MASCKIRERKKKAGRSIKLHFLGMNDDLTELIVFIFIDCYEQMENIREIQDGFTCFGIVCSSGSIQLNLLI